MTGLHCTILALQAQAALWEERADPVRQQLKQLQWELRGTHAAVRALERQVRETCNMHGLHCRKSGKPVGMLVHTVHNQCGHAQDADAAA